VCVCVCVYPCVCISSTHTHTHTHTHTLLVELLQLRKFKANSIPTFMTHLIRVLCEKGRAHHPSSCFN
jgi:hypothetical protein